MAKTPTPTGGEKQPQRNSDAAREMGAKNRVAEKSSRFSLSNYVAVMISLASLALSIATIYYNVFQPPDISAYIGIPILIWRSKIGIKADCVLSNSGTRTGVLEDIILVLENSVTHERAKYAPEAVIDEQKFTTQTAANPDVQWIQGEYRPISVVGKGSVMVPLLFMPLTEAAIDNKPAHYLVTPFVRQSGSAGWKQQQSFHIYVPSETIESTKKGTKVGVTPKELDNKRNEIK